MTNLRHSPREIRYQREQFYESLQVQGIPCLISSIKDPDTSHDFYGDVVETGAPFETAFDTKITFETTPTVYTLKSLGWYQDNSQGLPIIAHIPVLYEKTVIIDGVSTRQLTEFTPSIDDKILLTSNPEDTLVDPDTQEYLIKELQGSGFPSVIYYIAKVVPYRRSST